jgi:hypothetical protein
VDVWDECCEKVIDHRDLHFGPIPGSDYQVWLPDDGGCTRTVCTFESDCVADRKLLDLWKDLESGSEWWPQFSPYWNCWCVSAVGSQIGIVPRPGGSGGGW